MTTTQTEIETFFTRYAEALVARDERAMADHYAVPSLVLFPGGAVAVADAVQTEQFFAASWGQYEGVDEARPHVVLWAEAPGTVWADVTWSYGGEARERFCYQLVERDRGWRVGVLTPLPLGGSPVASAG